MNQLTNRNTPLMGSVWSLPVKTGLGIAGVGTLGGVIFSLGFAAGAEGTAAAGGGGRISWKGAGGKMAPVCLAMKFRMSSLRMRPSFPVPTTSLNLICEAKILIKMDHFCDFCYGETAQKSSVDLICCTLHPQHLWP